MRTVMILRGLPGCGKSTFARELMVKEPDRWRRVNRDDLRGMFGTTYSKSSEDFVRNVQDELIKQALADGKDVIIDNTHLIPMTVKKLHRILESVGDVKVIEKSFNVDLAECHRRNQLRVGTARVPDKVINDMARAAGIDKGRKLTDKESYYAPRGGTSTTRVNNDPSLPKAILCDLDGTLAIMGDRSPYDASQCDVKDHPNWPVIECVKAMHDKGVKIVFMSGRDSKYREQTVRFIEKWVRVPANWAFPASSDDDRPDDVVIPYELHMRVENDMRKDSIIKGELFDAHIAGKYHVLFVLDDRNQVVDFWRSVGLTCFQVAEGNF